MTIAHFKSPWMTNTACIYDAICTPRGKGKEGGLNSVPAMIEPV